MFGRDIEAITHVLLVSSTRHRSETINRPVEILVSAYAVFISSNVTLKIRN